MKGLDNVIAIDNVKCENMCYRCIRFELLCFNQIMEIFDLNQIMDIPNLEKKHSEISAEIHRIEAPSMILERSVNKIGWK